MADDIATYHRYCSQE